jgi:hypothetical protein
MGAIIAWMAERDQSKMRDDETGAAGRIHDAIQREAAVIGPHERDEDDEPILSAPVAGAVARGVDAVMRGTDPRSGRTIVTRTPSPGLPRHHGGGLPHEALYDFG